MFIDWTTVLSETISGLVVGLIVAIVGYKFLDKYAQRIAFAEKMAEYGFSNVSLEKQSQKEVKDMCNNATLIKLINVSGLHFLNDNRFFVKKALDKGCEIRFLCTRPDSSFLLDIEKMENNTISASGVPLREIDSHICSEVETLTEEYEKSGMKIRCYSSEYRLPYVIAYFPDGTKKAWLTMTLPPYKSTRSFVLRGKINKDSIYSSDVNFVEMMEKNFDTIWEHNSVSAEEYRRSLSSID